MGRRRVDQAMPPSSPPCPTAGPSAHPPASVKSLWRLRGYLRPHVLALAIMLGTALGGIALAIAIPAGHQGADRRPDHQRRDRRRAAARPPGPRARDPRGGADLLAPLGAVQRGAPDGDRDAPRPLRAAAGAPDELPQQVAVRPAALARHHRPVGDPAVQRLRPALPDHQHPPGHRGDRRAAATCTGRSASSSPSPPLRSCGSPCASRRGTSCLSRRVQDEQGDLATRAEEGAVGIRVIKSFGRSAHVSQDYDVAAQTAARHQPREGPARGPLLDLPGDDPQPRRRGRAAARRHRGGPRGPDARRAGRLHHADAVAGVAGGLARRDPGDVAGGDDRRSAHPRDLRHRARHRRRTR